MVSMVWKKDRKPTGFGRKKAPADDSAGTCLNPDLAARRTLLRLVHAHRAVDDLGIVHLFDRAVRLILIGHFNKTKPARAAGFPILNHFG